MPSSAASDREVRRGHRARFDLAFRAFLVAVLWATLRLLGGELDSFVSVAILVAVFGPDAVRTGREVLSEGLRSGGRSQ